MLPFHSAPSLAGDLHDPFAKAWWHHNVPSMHWHPSFGTSREAVAIPVIVQLQKVLVSTINAATNVLPEGANIEQRISTIKKAIGSVLGDGEQQESLKAAIKATGVLSNNIGLTLMFAIANPDAMDAAFLAVSHHSTHVEAWVEQAPNVHLLKNRFVQTFGLSQLMMDQSLLPLDQQVARLEKLEGVLHRACEKLNIAPTAWGHVAPTLSIVGPDNVLLPLNMEGIYQFNFHSMMVRETRRGHKVGMDVGTFVHEWTHALDHAVLQRHNIQTMAFDETASSFVHRTTVRERQSMNLPDDLQRSLALMARIGEEIKGQQSPMLQKGMLQRKVAQHLGKFWLTSSQINDERHGRAYMALDQEMLARMVEYSHVRPWGKATRQMFDELLRHEGMAPHPGANEVPMSVSVLGNRPVGRQRI